MKPQSNKPRAHAAALLSLFVSLAVSPAFTPGSARALPFNQDMVGGQNMPAGSIMRPRVPGTMPVGSLDLIIRTPQDAENLANPQAGDEASVKRGARLFRTNCAPCHGKYEANGNHQPGVVPGAPDFKAPGLISRTKPDGYIFKYIHFGGVLMPAYGWKFSPQEHWDLVNFVRHLEGVQGSNAK